MKRDMQQPRYYQVCSNDAPGLTLTCFMARSNFDSYASVWEKVKTMDFSETIVVIIIIMSLLKRITQLAYKPIFPETLVIYTIFTIHVHVHCSTAKVVLSLTSALGLLTQAHLSVHMAQYSTIS